MREVITTLLKGLVFLVISVVTALSRALIDLCRRHPREAKVAGAVITLHIVAIVAAINQKPAVTVVSNPQRVVVSTITLKKPAPPKPVAVASPKPKPKTSPTPRSDDKPKPKDADREKNEKLYRQALTSLDSVRRATNRSSDIDFSTPSALSSLQTETVTDTVKGSVSKADVAYCEELVRRLKLALRLPGYGDVKVQLTLSKDGSVAKLSILSAASEVNRSYIEATLPSLLFAPFGNNFIGEKQHSFILALRPGLPP